MNRLVAVLTALVLPAATLTGCLSTTHKISRGELGRLAQTQPEARGARVRVVQEFSTADAPPPATPVTSSTHVVVGVGISTGGHHHHRHRPAPRAVAGPSRSGAPRVSGAGKKGSELAALAVVVAAGAAIGLAVTEGARYDGWVEVHPMHPVHVWGPWGYAVVPFAHLDPGTAASADRAVIRPHEGPWRTLGRAPLDRAGFNYSLLGGAASIPSADGTTELGPGFHIQLGYFPSHALGIVADASLSWRRNTVGNTIYDNRWGAERQFLPLDAGHFHAGLFGGAALGSRIEDGVRGGNDRGLVFGGGAMAQLSITTRLALTARFGIGRAYDDTTQDITFGLSIY